MIALTDEQLRILRAAHDGRLVFGRVGNIDRWYIISSLNREIQNLVQSRATDQV